MSCELMFSRASNGDRMPFLRKKSATTRETVDAKRNGDVRDR